MGLLNRIMAGLRSLLPLVLPVSIIKPYMY